MKASLPNIINLKYFCDAVKLGGVSRSAAANFVTQSAISQGIAKLEESLGFSLLAHHPKHFKLTPLGESFFAEACDILKRIDRWQELFSHEQMGDLEFGCTFSFGLTVIPALLKKFNTNFPLVKMRLHMGKNEEVKKMLKEGAIDFGILPDEGDLDAFEKEMIYRGHLKFYAAKSVTRKEEKKLGFILAAPSARERLLLNESFSKKQGKEPTGILEVNSWEVASSLASLGMGIGYFPDYIGRKKEYALKEIDLGLRPLPYQISAIFPRGMKRRKSSELFLSYFEEI